MILATACTAEAKFVAGCDWQGFGRIGVIDEPDRTSIQSNGLVQGGEPTIELLDEKRPDRTSRRYRLRKCRPYPFVQAAVS